jgi:non-heme chloroperoxidase
MMDRTKAHYDRIKASSETELCEDLTRIDVPTLARHGDDDEIVPIPASRASSSPKPTSSARTSWLSSVS